MTYFHTLPILARPVARAQLDSYRLVNLYWSYEEVDWPGTDFVILATAEKKTWQMAAVGRGGRGLLVDGEPAESVPLDGRPHRVELDVEAV